MKIRSRNNRTKRYLFPIVNTFGSTFIKQLNSLTNYTNGYPITQSILSITFSDLLYCRAKQFTSEEIRNNPYLFIVFDTLGTYNVDKDLHMNVKEGKKRFGDFLKYIRTNKYYNDDYWFSSNQHCIVFSIDKYHDAYKYFLLCKYSKMYSLIDVENVKITKSIFQGGKEYYNIDYAVLVSEEKVGTINLKKVIYESFGTEDIPDSPLEYDIPWFTQEEVLNSQYITLDENEMFKSLKYE